MGIRLILLIGLLSAVSALPAAPLYLELVERAELDDEALEKAREQTKEHEAITVIDELPLPPFHRRHPRPRTAKQPFCRICHLSPPHRKDVRARTFLNMHSRFIACETCHFRPREVGLEYRWLAYDGGQAGRPVAPRAVKEGDESLVPSPGARIVPFHGGEAAVVLADHPFAAEVERRWEKGGEEERARLKARLHVPLEKSGPKCGECHGERSPLLDLRALGAGPARLHALRRNAIVRLFERLPEDEEKGLRIDDWLR